MFTIFLIEKTPFDTVKTKALIAATSLVWLEIRSRDEESINPTRNRIYSLKIFYFLVYRRRYFLFVSNLI